MKYDTIMTSPLGKLGIKLNDGAVYALDYLPDEIPESHHSIAENLKSYFDNKNDINLAVQPHGTEYQKRVWHALTEIPFGTTMTYGELAKKLKSSPRAVGQACRKNPITIIIPCHRVVSATGLGGYAGDTTGKLIKIKQWLLEHEK